MTGKEEIEVKSYMQGKYIEGAGNAHKFCANHTPVFNCEMFGTFNIKLKHGRIDEFAPTITTKKANYYFLQIKKNKRLIYGWAVRDHGSYQIVSHLEIVTKKIIPDFFKDGTCGVTILEKWNDAHVQKWAKNKYWFQTFPFTPTPKADSAKLWKIIDTHVDSWSGLKVLDIGSHYGYFSFGASEKGAQVLGVEINKESINCANIIRDNIIQQDVKFIKKDNNKEYDIILYLSVHHQIDPSYAKLGEKIQQLKTRTQKHLFVELILPPTFPVGAKMSEDILDQIVQMKILHTYKHRIRGIRRVYMWGPNE